MAPIQHGLQQIHHRILQRKRLLDSYLVQKEQIQEPPSDSDADQEVSRYSLLSLLIFRWGGFLAPSSMQSRPHRHQFHEESLAFRIHRSNFYLLHLEFRPVQSLVMFIGEVASFKDMSFEGFVVGKPVFVSLCCHIN